jgi:hypothetical protein
MMGDLLAALSHADEGAWRNSESAQGAVTWLPLWLISGSGLWIGLDRNGRWVVGRVTGQVSSPGEPLSPGWLPLLDHDEAEVREEISFISTKYGLPLKTLLDTLPINDTIKLALTTSNAHWIDRALAWLKSRAVSHDFLPALYNVSKSKTASQQARQRARHLMQRIQQQSS